MRRVVVFSGVAALAPPTCHRFYPHHEMKIYGEAHRLYLLHQTGGANFE
ncbi:MAG: hypothetical protein AAFV29_25050 [Myxococcota bacterium]